MLTEIGFGDFFNAMYSMEAAYLALPECAQCGKERQSPVRAVILNVPVQEWKAVGILCCGSCEVDETTVCTYIRDKLKE